jgi:hypothetical protein
MGEAGWGVAVEAEGMEDALGGAAVAGEAEVRSGVGPGPLELAAGALTGAAPPQAAIRAAVAARAPMMLAPPRRSVRCDRIGGL